MKLLVTLEPDETGMIVAECPARVMALPPRRPSYLLKRVGPGTAL
jgi:hypothetical protein